MMQHKRFYWWALMTLVFLGLPATALAADNPPGVAYRGHIQDFGDYPTDGSWVDSPAIIGTVGQSKRIEGFEIKLTGTVPEGMELRYNVHVQNKGWLYDEDDCSDWPKDGAYAGTRGDSLRIEAVKIVLTDGDGQPVPGYSVQYRGHVQNIGDLPKDTSQWLADGEQLGTVGSSLRLEALLVQVVKTGTDPVEPAEPLVYDAPGSFGPKQGSETIASDVIVAADGVTLDNLTIAGDLTISEAVGDGTVTLNNVTVEGDTLVRGGGVHSIKINGGQYRRIIMEKTASGAVRIVATGVDGLEVVVAEDASGEEIILEGSFASVTVNAPNMRVTTQGNNTTIRTMTVGVGAGGSTLNLANGTTVSELVLDGKAAVKGQGNVIRATINADGVVFDKKPGSYTVEPGVVIPPVFPTPDSGGGYNPPAPVAVTGVSLNKNSTTLTIGASETLVATVTPTGAANQAVTWASSNGAVATVDPGSGLVTAVAVGTAKVTVTTTDGSKQASCDVTVNPIAVTGVSLNYQTLNRVYGESATLQATVTPADATNPAVSFSSSNEAVVTVDATSGEIQAINAGTATITATAVSDNSKTATCTVTVTLPALISEIKGIPIPFNGDHPVMSITETDQYRGSITWTQSVTPLTADDVFDGSKSYTATISLILKAPYTSDLISTSYFTIPGAVSYNSNKSATVTATFYPLNQYRVDAAGTIITAYSGPGKALILPDKINETSLTGIASNAFQNKNLTEITIPDEITSIDSGAFADNPLTRITIGAAVTITDDTAMGINGSTFNEFYTGQSLAKGNYSFWDGVWHYSGNQVDALWYDSTGVVTGYGGTQKNLVIPTSAGITAIAPEALVNKGIVTLSLPDSITSIGADAFKGNPIIDIQIGTDVLIASDAALGNATTSFKTAYAANGPGSYHCYYDIVTAKPNWFFSNAVENGMAFNQAAQTINSYTGAGGALTIPADFSGVAVKTIHKECFRSKDLTALDFATGSTLITIEASSFYQNALTSVVFPATLESIGGSAFESCRLNSVILPVALKTISIGAFVSNELTSITIPDAVTSIGQQAFVNNKLTRVVIEGTDGSDLTIGLGAFQSLNADSNLITEITLPAGVTITDNTAMGRYGAAFKAFYEDVTGNNKQGGVFSYDTGLGQWSKQ